MNQFNLSKTRRTALKLGFGALFLAAGLSACGETPSLSNQDIYEAEQSLDAVFYLVRHAEKELDGEDPALSDAGYARADALAGVLGDVTFAAIYSTDTRRTRETAAPSLAATGLTLKLYDGRALIEFAQSLSEAQGNYLIVGHSNTTPQLAEALGGEGGDPITEATEYDRLYVLTRTGGVTVTELRRYP